MRCIARALALSMVAGASAAAPDEDRLGASAGYPVAPSLAEAYRDRYIVGSFSAMDRIAPFCELAPAERPRALPKAATETVVHYRFAGRDLTLDDYMQRQRATAVLVVKDGELVAERYNYGRTDAMRMLSNSMAKTIVALALMKAHEDGLIRSFDDTAETYVPALKGSLYGGTRLSNLMRMASGARYVEEYSATDDRARFNAVVRREGTLAGLRSVTERAEPEGEVFNYAGAQTQVLGLVLRAATGRTLCDAVDAAIWKPIGAEAKATWLVNPVDGVEIASGAFNATVRDYARLGMMMAEDGVVDDGPERRTVVSREHLLDMTDAMRQPISFRPGRMAYHGGTYMGYGYQTWILPGSHRRFALLGVYG